MKYIGVIFLGFLLINDVKGNGLEVIANEHWSFSKGHPAAGYFNSYYFYDDGTFEHEYGYSGGAFYSNHISGKYYYNASDKTIRLEASRPGNHLIPIKTPFKTPLKISIIEYSDTAIKITENDNTEIISMHRKPGITSDSHWFKGWHSSGDCFRFTKFGQCEIKLNEIEYVCEYGLVDNMLYLEIKAKRLNRKIEKQDPFKKIFIRTKINDETVMIEKVDMENIVPGTRDWERKDGEYRVINEVPENEIIWEEYNRRKDNRKQKQQKLGETEQ